jgi:hypothetical protein
MENNLSWIKEEIGAMIEFSKDESLPITLRMTVKKILKDIKTDIDKMIIELS